MPAVRICPHLFSTFEGNCMKARLIPGFAVALLAASPALAGDFTLSLTEESVKAQVNATNSRSELAFGGGYTYHEGKRHIANIDFHAQGRTAIGNLPTTAGVGMRGLAYDDDDYSDGGGLALGGFATMNIPTVPGLSVNGDLHYAPSILSFGDADSLVSVSANLSYRVIRNAEIFGGYRYLNADLDVVGDHDVTLDSGVMAGLKILF